MEDGERRSAIAASLTGGRVARRATRPGCRSDLPARAVRRKFIDVRPKGRASGPEGPAPSCSGQTPTQTELLGVPGLQSPGRRISPPRSSNLMAHGWRGKVEKLPFWDAVRCCGGSVRSLRTQQRALVKCQITSIQLRLNEIPLDQSPALRCRQRIVSNDIPLVRSNSLGQSISG